MASMKEAALAFLACRRIAVTGVSHAPKGHGSNAVYQRLKQRGYQVFAVNPAAPEAEGDATYPSLAAIPGGVEAVVIGTHADRAEATMREAVALGVKQVWMHRAFGPGSVSEAATRYGREHGVTVIDGGCPLMFGAAADPAHRVMCTVLQLFGKVPRTV
jgi:predicted CoA-binding protein